MSQTQKKPSGKLIITGTIELLTGLHIGCGGQSGIGLIDSPVLRHPVSNEPYIPGSSLKGRLRFSLDQMFGLDSPIVLKMFGSTPNNNKGNEKSTSQIYIRDCHLSPGQKLKDLAEVKYENKISRKTGAAEGGLRQIERIVAGTTFEFEVVYNIDDNYETDLKNLKSCFEYVEDEYLGASGSRGYGKVKFHFRKITHKPLEYYISEENYNEKEIVSNNWLSPAIEIIKS
jgi:CRISPR-associated protein Csm3